MDTVETIKIQLTEGAHVRDPDTMQLIGSEPIIVEKKSYWMRRIGDGSVKIVEDTGTKRTRQNNQAE